MKKITTTLGAAVGALTYSSIGGMGLAVGGTAVGITLGPMITIGAGVGLITGALLKRGSSNEGGMAIIHTDMYDE